jgi:hypothetical protein
MVAGNPNKGRCPAREQISDVENDKSEPDEFEDDEFKENDKALNDQGEGKGTNSFCPSKTLQAWF